MMTDDTRQIREDSKREHAPIVKLSIDWRFAERKGKGGRLTIEGTVPPATEKRMLELWADMMGENVPE